MHRVRTSVAYYRSYGWNPIILSVDPDHANCIRDDRLLALLPRDLEVIRVHPVRASLTRLFGVTALGIRAWPALRRAGLRVLESRSIDLVFFSTTQFFSLTLGPVWKRRTGVPFVLDFQDPWYPGENASTRPLRRGVKHRLARWFHKRLERATVPKASGLMATSAAYLSELTTRYPKCQQTEQVEIPFGFDPKDFKPAKSEGSRKNIALYLGATTYSMKSAIDAVFGALHFGIANNLQGFADLQLNFVGTSYGSSDNSAWVIEAANKAGVSGRVRIEPKRLPFLDAQSLQSTASCLLVLGQQDAHYRPSKLAGVLYAGKPVLISCVSARVAADLEALPAIAALNGNSVQDDAMAWSRILTSTIWEIEQNQERASQWRADSLTARQCRFFDSCASGAAVELAT